MRRRDLFALLGGSAAAWPLRVRSQQAAPPVVGWLNLQSATAGASWAAAFRSGLAQEGLEDGRNVRVEYRWGEGDYDRMPDLVAEIIALRPAVVACGTIGPASLLKKIASAGIPVVFVTGGDPVAEGLVASLAQPGGNLTGVRIFTGTLSGKRLSILHELVPHVTNVAVLLRPLIKAMVDEKADIDAVAQKLNLTVMYSYASDDAGIDDMFALFARTSPGALLVGPSPAFASRRNRIVALANAHALPAIYEAREFALAGGLISYGDSIVEGQRLLGIQTGKILKGANPADLPVVQSTKFETVLNLKTAKALGIDVPTLLLARVDEVVE